MSSSVRNDNLFSGEDYKKVFKAYSFIDYTAYDFDTLKQALINYVQTYYPEDFNDYIESSEFIAIIELLAYFGTSLAFRTDLNSRENFIDTAERRESIIRLAQMVNYVPRRNVPASGLFKIAAVQTNQPLTDANGINIDNSSIFWNDPNNPDWFDQYVQVCNAAFSTINPFGRPTKSGTIGSIPTDLYQLNSLLMQNVTYPLTLNVNGQQFPVDVCNPDFVTNQTIFERNPDPANAFNFIYRNDSLGVASANTGFFLYFKQGNLINIDTNFEFPVPNRLFPVDIQNINQDDVYVQETDQQGNVINHWLKVPALAGENIIYNSIQYGQRNIFDVISGANDSISIRFADGNFGNVPTGLFRTWVRTSANQDLVIRPDSAQGMQLSIPYIGVDQQQYTLKIVFNLEQTVGNAAASETNEQIKLRAPEVFSTQSRMVNGSDYNVLPLVYGNQIAKIQAIGRTYSGQSRYIDLNDPTGFHRDLLIFGQDGALYRDNDDILLEVSKTASNAGNITTVLVNSIQEVLRDTKVSNFFYDEYITQFESTDRGIRVNKNTVAGPNYAPDGYSILDLANPASNQLYWRTSPGKFKNTTGYFSNITLGTTPTAQQLINSLDRINTSTGTYQPWGMITNGAVLEFGTQSVAVNSVTQIGLPLIANPSNPYSDTGPVELGADVQTGLVATKVYPRFRNELNSSEITEIVSRINNGISFWLYYDLLSDKWGTSITTTAGIANQSQQPWFYAPPIHDVSTGQTEIYSNWENYANSGLLYVNIVSNNEIATTSYNITARGRVYVFESYRDVRFFWEPNQVIIDNTSGLALQDTIEIMPFVNTNSTVNNNNPVISNPSASYIRTPINFTISGVHTQDDGYQDESKIQVSLADTNNDGLADDPAGFDKIVSFSDRIVFEYYTNEVSGYQSTRPWIAKWGTELASYSGGVQVHFNAELGNPSVIDTVIIADAAGAPIIDLTTADLILISNLSQLAFSETTNALSIANQVTAFFNGTDNGNESGSLPFTTYTWLNGTESIEDKANVVTNYFVNKSFLLSPSNPGYGIYHALAFEDTPNKRNYPTGKVIKSLLDLYHYDKNGKVFTQNTSVPVTEQIPFYFKWSHYSPVDQRIDPAATNIVDMITITNGYYTDITNWKNNSGTLATKPIKPTTEELRIQFQNLDQYKMVSDSIIWNSGEFRVLFGPQAASELQATFKVVKAPSSSVSDNEIKTQVIQAIDIYFDIRNWDFGETFFYTELAAFIHQQLSRTISSVIIVPNNASSQFGNLFEIAAGPNQLFISTATVNNVQIVSNLTDQNMRI
jgi:hypothetical protein